MAGTKERLGDNRINSMFTSSGSKAGGKSWLKKFISYALSKDLKTFIIPGIEMARINGLNLKVTELTIVDTPRHASILLIIGELTPALHDVVSVIYAQMMRPRAVYLMTNENSEATKISAHIVTEVSQSGLISGVEQLKILFKNASFTTSSQDFSPKILSVIEKYTCPMHPEIMQDEPGNCPKCGMTLIAYELNSNTDEENQKHSSETLKTQKDHSKMDHSKMDHSKMDHSKMDHSKMDHSKMDHSKMDHSKMDHSKMDHSKMDHSKMDHSKMDHSKMDHSKMTFMSMVEMTKDLPRSEDGLQMEWIDLPFGPLFPGLPSGLFINFTLDGDTVVTAKIKHEYAINALIKELPMHSGCFIKRLFSLNPMIHGCLSVLIHQIVAKIKEQKPDIAISNDGVGVIERERIVNHLSWFCQFGKQTGIHNLVQKAESLQLQVLKAGFDDFEPLSESLERFVTYALKIPMLKMRTQNIGKLSANNKLYGPVARSLFIDNDVRSEDSSYKNLNFKAILEKQGDTFTRYKIRALEINQSLSLIRQLGSSLKPEMGDLSDLSGTASSQVESPRGKLELEITFLDGTVQSFKFKTPTSSHISLINPLIKQQEIGDALVNIGSLDLLPSEVMQ